MATRVWIATKVLEEHRAAIDWLNSNTNDRFDFFGVEIEVLQIVGCSPAAPRFNVVAKPNDWSRVVGQAAGGFKAGVNGETQALYQEYWLALKAAYEQAGEPGRFPKPRGRQWLSSKKGEEGVFFFPVLLCVV